MVNIHQCNLQTSQNKYITAVQQNVEVQSLVTVVLQEHLTYDITRINLSIQLGGNRNAHFLLPALSIQIYVFVSSVIHEQSHSGDNVRPVCSLRRYPYWLLSFCRLLRKSSGVRICDEPQITSQFFAAWVTS